MKISKYEILQNGSDSYIPSKGMAISIIQLIIVVFGIGFNSFNHLGAQGGCVLACPPMNPPKEVSIDNDCVDTLSIDLLGVTSNGNCAGPFQIQIMDDNQMDLGDIITQDMINEVYMVVITNLDDNQVCMTAIKVVDKQLPEIVACPPDVTFACTFDINDYDARDQVDVIECSQYTVTSFDDVVYSASCQGDTVSKYNRTYIVTDEYNNSTTCTQMIALLKADLTDVTFPPSLTLDCFPAPDTTPVNTGSPTIDGYSISNGLFCNLSFTYADQIADLCSGGYKIIRVFTVTDWCDNNSTSTGQQVIEVLDRTPPVVVAPPDAVVSTTSDECTTDITLPPAMISEDCSSIQSVRIQWPFGTMNTNGGVIENLPVGVYDIAYIVTNDCDSIGRDTIRVTVVDNEPPNPICHQSVSIPVAANGEVIIPASSLDAASYDNCGPVWFKAKRMTPPVDYDCYPDGNPNYLFDDLIKLCCEDIPHNNLMVILRVYDREPVEGPVSDSYLAGRWNECMMEVEVQDKIAPTIECPTDLTVSCEFNFDPNNLSVFGSIAASPLEREQICIDDPGANPPGYQCIGLDGVASDNCIANVSEAKIIDIDSCGSGAITRTFTASDNSGFSSSCTQSILVKNFLPFNRSMIDWPDDYETQDICNVDLLDPEDLPLLNSQPILTSGPCDLVTFNHTDDVYDFSQFDQACFKIVRKWTVIDWCQFDSDGTGKWEYYQTIKSLNTVPPTIDSIPGQIDICSLKPDCGPETVSLAASATDDCSGPNTLTWQYQIDLNNDNIIDQAVNAGTGSSVSFEFDFEIGTHRVIFTVFDKCTNKTTKEQLIHITSCIGPSPKCIVGLSTSLMPVDLDNDETTDWGMVTIWASDFDAGSDHPCGLDFSLAFSEDPTDISRTFNCDQVGENTIGLYAIDERGLTDVCFTYIEIQDNGPVCPNVGNGNGTNGFIAGGVKTEQNENVGSAMIYLNGSEIPAEPTSAAGTYAFTNMPFGGTYEIEPRKDGDDMNGVSTLDLLRIQRHLLGIENLESPYQYIAADANRSGNVTAIDILELRKLILGIHEELPENTSWRFVDANYQFTDPNNPLDEAYPEVYQVQPFASNMAQVDFTGVKIGDLNGSVQANLVSPEVITRSQKESLMIMYDADVKKKTIRFTGMNMAHFSTAQFSLKWDSDKINVVEVVPANPFMKEQFNVQNIEKGVLTFAWFDHQPDLSNQTELFTLRFESKQSDPVFPILTLDKSPTRIEASTLTGEVRSVQLHQALQVNAQNGVKLYQNMPNPFSHITEIRFDLPGNEEVEFSIYDMSGKQVMHQQMEGVRGVNRIQIHKNEINANGVLVYELKTASGIESRRMIID